MKLLNWLIRQFFHSFKIKLTRRGGGGGGEEGIDSQVFNFLEDPVSGESEFRY